MSPRLSAAERREAILEAAIPLFAEQGFDAVTTRDIASAAGVSEALLYRHFQGKQGIYEAIQGACVDGATEPKARLAALPENTASLVLCVFALMWKIQRGPEQDVSRHSQMRRLVCRSLLGDGHFAATFLRRTSRPWVDKMRACLKAAIAAGDVVSSLEDAELGIWLGHHVSVTIQTYSLSETTIVDYPGGADRLLERTVEFCLRGLGMTNGAIATHYHPEQLALLLSA